MNFSWRFVEEHLSSSGPGETYFSLFLTHCFSSLRFHACKEQQSTCPLGLPCCNGLPATHYSYKVSANHTIDRVIPPIWNSLPQLVVWMSKVQVSVFSLVGWGTCCLWGSYWEPCSFSTSFAFFLVFIRHRLNRKKKSATLRRNTDAEWLNDFLPFETPFGTLTLCFVELCFAMLCCIFVVQVKTVTSDTKVGCKMGSLRLWTLMEYQ